MPPEDYGPALARIEAMLEEQGDLIQETSIAVHSIQRANRLAFWAKVVIWALVIILPFIVLVPLIKSLAPGVTPGGANLLGIPTAQQIQDVVDTYREVGN